MLSDIFSSRVLPRDTATWQAELKTDHRVKDRIFLLNYIPPDSVGAELGVFTGLFSAILSRQTRAKKITFVDPWWLAFGDHYPSWGAYTANGRLSTRAAHDLASARVAQPGLGGRAIEVAYSYDWLATQPDHSLDWVYLDSTHTYEGTKAELELLGTKIKPDGVILGDDWQSNRDHRHHGVCLAVNEFVSASEFEIIFAGVASQWAVRRKAGDRTSLPMLVKDTIYRTADIPVDADS